MECININDTPLKLITIPKKYNGIMGYNSPSNSSKWYEDGFREFLHPTIDRSTHSLGSIIYDSELDKGTRELIPLSEEEIASKLLQSQIDIQTNREERGKEEFRKMTAELRTQVGIALDLATYNAIEVILEPLGDTVCQGKWTKAYNMLVELGSDLIGQDLYDTLELKLREGIIELYEEHDYPFTV